MAISQAIQRTVVALTVLLACGLSQAQEVKELARHPGDTIKFEIKFDGPDAAKVKTVSLNLSTTSTPLQTQVGFSTGFNGQAMQTTTPNTFHAELKVPDYVATGDYTLGVSVGGENGAGSATYSAGKDFQLHPIHIENPRTFTPPHITVKEQP